MLAPNSSSLHHTSHLLLICNAELILHLIHNLRRDECQLHLLLVRSVPCNHDVKILQQHRHEVCFVLPPHVLLHDTELDAFKFVVHQHLLQLFGVAPRLHQRQLRQRVRGLHTLLHLSENRLEAKCFPERYHRDVARLERAVNLLRARHGVLKEEDAEVDQDCVE